MRRGARPGFDVLATTAKRPRRPSMGMPRRHPAPGARRARAVLLAMLALAVAGCAAPAPATAPAAEQGGPAAPTRLDWSQADCQSITWSVPVLASDLRGRLPAGFEPSEPATGSPLVAGQLGVVSFRAVECVEGFGATDILRSVQSGSVFTPVVPPAELRDDRFGPRYAYGWDVMVASESWRDAAAGWRLPLHDGGAMAAPSAQGWSGALAIDAVGAFRMTGRTLDAGQPASDRECRLVTSAGDGLALWDAAYADLVIANGVGVWDVNPESWVAELLGATQGTATFELAAWSIPHATVQAPGGSFGPVEPRAGAAGEGAGGAHAAPAMPRASLVWP